MKTQTFLEEIGFYEALGIPIPNLVVSYLAANALDFSYFQTDNLEKTLFISVANFALRTYALNEKKSTLNKVLFLPELSGASLGRNIHQKVKAPISNLAMKTSNVIKNSYGGLKNAINKIKSKKNLEGSLEQENQNE